MALTVAVAEDGLDGFVLALAAERIAVRRLELVVSPLESMFFALSEDREFEDLAPDVLADRVFADSER